MMNASDLARIAAALERLAPPPPAAADPAAHPAYVWRDGVLVAARAFRSADLFAGVILLGLIGLVSNLALQEIERYMLRWKRR